MRRLEVLTWRDRGVMAGLLLVGLVTWAGWLLKELGEPGSITLSVPLGMTSVFHVNVWSHETYYIDRENTPDASYSSRERPLRVALWYQNTAAVSIRRLFVLRMPDLPLRLMPVSTALVALLFGYSRCRSRSGMCVAAGSWDYVPLAEGQARRGAG